MPNITQIPAIQRRAARISRLAYEAKLTPKVAATRIETLVCSRCPTQVCAGCKVADMIASHRKKEKW